jgi:hypothetical protein
VHACAQLRRDAPQSAPRDDVDEPAGSDRSIIARISSASQAIHCPDGRPANSITDGYDVIGGLD